MDKPYRWKVTRASDVCPEAMEVEGPGGLDPDIKDNRTWFSVYDDDDVFYFGGYLYGDFDGFEPLDDYGMPNFGAAHIKLEGDTHYL